MKKLSLQKLSQNELEKREMNQLLGGDNSSATCNCGCAYTNVFDNGHTNMYYGYTQSSGNAGGQYSCECNSSSDLASTRQMFAKA